MNFPNDSDDVPTAMPWIEDADGNSIDKPTAAAVSKHLRATLQHIANQNRAPAKWGEADVEVQNYLRAEMYTAFPCLQLCAFHWKLNKVLVGMYPWWIKAWRRKGGFVVVKGEPQDALKVEAPDDISPPSATTIPAKRKERESPRSHSDSPRIKKKKKKSKTTENANPPQAGPSITPSVSPPNTAPSPPKNRESVSFVGPPPTVPLPAASPSPAPTIPESATPESSPGDVVPPATPAVLSLPSARFLPAPCCPPAKFDLQPSISVSAPTGLAALAEVAASVINDTDLSMQASNKQPTDGVKRSRRLFPVGFAV